MALLLVLIVASSVYRATGSSASGWTRVDLKPVTQPAPAGDVLVLYVVQDELLYVVGLDAATGETVWSDAASTGSAAPGVSPWFAVVSGRLIYLRGVDGSTAELVAADAKSGKEVWHTEPGDFASPPSVCADDPAAICLSGLLSSQQEERLELRFDANTGRQLPGANIASDYGREVGPNLFDPGQRNPERLVATRHASVSWTRPLASIFTLPGGVSTDWGWNFEKIEPVALFVGSAGSEPIRETATRLIYDLSREMTAGFRTRNGAVVWRSHGSYACGILPCAGAAQTGYSTQHERPVTVGLRLIMRGRLSAPETGAASPIASRDAHVTIQGFAPATGRSLWSFDGGRNVGLITLELLPAQVDRNTIALRDNTGDLVALDLARGSRRALPRTAEGWCRKTIRYRQAVGYEIAEDETTHEYYGQDALFPCTALTQARRSIPGEVPSYVGGIGARAGGLIIWSDATGVIARPAAD